MTAPANADNKALSGLGFLSRIARNKNFGRIFAISLARLPSPAGRDIRDACRLQIVRRQPSNRPSAAQRRSGLITAVGFIADA